MAENKASGLRERLLFLLLSMVAVLASWLIVRLWLSTALAMSLALIHIMDAGILSATALVVIIIATRLVAKPIAAIVGPTQSNTVKLLLQLGGMMLILVVGFSILGWNVVSALVGLGFFGIVIGLAAQSVLGNLF
jgi:small-conductance mechanosensitive channel